MALLFYAQPYNIEVEGFYFRTLAEYDKNVDTVKDSFGQPVEEFEIQFIDGDLIDSEFAKTVGLNQANIGRFIELADIWDDQEKIRFIIAVGECGHSFDIDEDDIGQLEVDIYEETSLRELAIRFVDDGLFGEIPKHLENYIDYEAIARDLAFDYTQTTIAGEQLIYRCD